MAFIEIVNYEKGKLIFFEEKEWALEDKKDYLLGESYACEYKINHTFSFERKIVLLAESDFIFELAEREFLLPAKSGSVFKIIFRPMTVGDKHFKLTVVQRGREPEITLLDRTLKVMKKLVNIESQLRKPLPNNMKLGQKAEAIFLFMNKSDEMVTNINIRVTEQGS